MKHFLRGTAEASRTYRNRRTVTVTPAAGQSGYALITLVVGDGSEQTSASFEITVTNNSAPVLANIETQTLTEGITHVFRAAANDADVDQELTYSLEWLDALGQVMATPWNVTFDTATGLFLWAPDESYGPGVYTARVMATDNGDIQLSDSQQFTINVLEHNLRPTIYGPGWPWPFAWPRAVEVNFEDPFAPDGQASFTLSSSDNDDPSQNLTYELVSGPGQIVDSATGHYVWNVPNTTPVQTVDVKFRVTDNGSPARSHEIVVPITITRNYETTRDAPVANSESYQLQHDQPFDSRNYNTDIGHRSLLDNDSWFDGQLPQITIVQQPAHGTVVVDAYGHFTYTPHAGVVFAGLDTFRYRLTDRAQGNYTHETTVSLHIHNAEPAGVDRWYNASQGRQLQVSTSNGVLNDIFTDGDGDATKATVSEPPAHGTVTLGVDGDFTYTPNPGFWGTDSFVIKLDERDALKKYFENIEATFSDDREQYAIVHLNVAQNSPPTANDDDYTIPFVAGSLAVNAIDGVLANDFDPDGAIEDLVALLVAGSPASTGFTSTGC